MFCFCKGKQQGGKKHYTLDGLALCIDHINSTRISKAILNKGLFLLNAVNNTCFRGIYGSRVNDVI